MSRSLFARLHARFGPRGRGVTRREVLRRAMAAATGAALLPMVRISRASEGSRGRILIIGAGLAGLSAAYQLTERGYRVIVIEARPRISGRVRSLNDFVDGRSVEGGGEFIGSNHPTWLAYANRFGLEFLDVSEDEELDFPVVIDGRLLSQAEALDVYEGAVKASKAINHEATDVDAERPWLSPLAQMRDSLPTACRIAAFDISENARKAINAQTTADNGVSTEMQSYLANLAMVKGGGLDRFWTDSEVYRCKGGNQQLAEALAAAIGSDQIVISTPVESISQDEHGALVRTNEGLEFRGDYVILTAPPSTWHRIRFDPGLPPELDIQMGSNVKYLSLTRKRFWLDAGSSQYALANADVQETWEGTDGQAGDAGIVFACFSGGPASERTRAFPPAERDEKYAAMLSIAYPQWRENFLRSLYLDWPGEKWSEASYAFAKPGEVTKAGPTLYEGVGRLRFAGEYASYPFPGYMEGALSTGIRAARQIAGEI